jgi:L-lactate dehydrogenase complex protein LldG
LRGVGADLAARDIRRERDKLGSAPPPALPCADLAEAFLANVVRNRGSIDRAVDRAAAVQAVARYLYDHYRSQRLVVSNDPRLAALPWRDAGLLPRFGATAPGEPVALSYAQLGVAELGAVVTWTGKANPSANNLLPEHHLVLVDQADLVATTEDAWQRLRAQTDGADRPRGINFIAGPSSTADIEGKLVYGAHGPRNWHLILLGELPEDILERAHQRASS